MQLGRMLSSIKDDTHHNVRPTTKRTVKREPKNWNATARPTASHHATPMDNIAESIGIARKTHLNAVSDTESDSSSTFIIDSGASPSHLNTLHPRMSPLKSPIPTKTAMDTNTLSTHCGNVTIQTDQGHKIHILALYNQSLNANLLSVHALVDQCGTVVFNKNAAYIVNTNKNKPRLIDTAPFINRAYTLKSHAFSSRTVSRPLPTRTKAEAAPAPLKKRRPQRVGISTRTKP